MGLIIPKIIAPDSSHWAKWLDAARSPDPNRRNRALEFHGRLIECNRIPLLTWHHVEELLGVEDDRTARDRIEMLEKIPLLAWLRLPHEKVGLGSFVQVMVAEVIASIEGHRDLVSVRDRARELILHVGKGTQAIGQDAWVWNVMRLAFHEQKSQTDIVAALGPVRIFDERKTVGELSQCRRNSPDKFHLQLSRIYDQLLKEAQTATAGDLVKSKLMADEFMERAFQLLPSPNVTVREMIVNSFLDQGLDEHEIRDECLISDLSRLGLFRKELKVIAADTGHSFEELKQVSMDVLPSWVIREALRNHGQLREKRPGSDVNDAYLSVLAAYCDVLYVDKRTAEDFRRASRKEKRLNGLIGEIAKAADFEELVN